MTDLISDLIACWVEQLLSKDGEVDLNQAVWEKTQFTKTQLRCTAWLAGNTPQ